MKESRSIRFVSLDLYRFIAASGVVALHFAEFTEHPSQDWLRYSTSEFYLFVDFFFILSGFVIAHTYAHALNKPHDILQYLRRRFARVYPLYFLTLLFFAVVALSGLSHYPDRSRAASIISQILMISSWSPRAASPYNLPAWSISVEWAMYLVFPLVAILFRRFGLWILLLIIMIGFLANDRYINSGILAAPLWALDINPIRALPTFTTGIVIALSIEKYSVTYGATLGFFAFLVSILMMINQANIYCVLFTFSLAIFLTACGELKQKPAILNNRFVEVLGDASYSVYMLHIIVIMITIDFVWKRITGDVEFPVLLFGLVVFPMIVLFSILTYRAVEKPIRNILSGRRRAFRPAQFGRRNILALLVRMWNAALQKWRY